MLCLLAHGYIGLSYPHQQRTPAFSQPEWTTASLHFPLLSIAMRPLAYHALFHLFPISLLRYLSRLFYCSLLLSLLSCRGLTGLFSCSFRHLASASFLFFYMDTLPTSVLRYLFLSTFLAGIQTPHRFLVSSYHLYLPLLDSLLENERPSCVYLVYLPSL